MNPTHYMSDFESACIKATKLVFPAIENAGCYFHLMQSFRRQADKHELKTILENDDLLMFQFKKLRFV